MNLENFNLAMSIIVKSHSTKIHINKTTSEDSVTKVLANPTIHIEDCVPKVIINLSQEGFTVFMQEGLLAVTKHS